jgi:Tat protein secretion system quality control protein TatD with DNase activity
VATRADGKPEAVARRRPPVGALGDESKPDGFDRAGTTRLHYETDFAAPVARVRTPSGDRDVLFTIIADGLLYAELPRAGTALHFHVRDRVTGREDRPPGGGEYLLPGDLDQVWLAKGTIFDVDPRRIPDLLIDAHTHPYERAEDGGLRWDPAPLCSALRDERIGLALTMLAGPLAEQRSRLVELCRREPRLVPIVWVEPLRDSPAEVERLLERDGFRGIKFHSTLSEYPIDGPAMDGFLRLAAKRGFPVQLHTAIDENARPERLAALARRHPEVPIIMVHAELGAADKSRTLELVRGLPNVYVETSWTNPESVLATMDAMDSARTLFGTDASVDSYEHFDKKSIANPRGEYVYSVSDVVAKVREWAHPDAFANWARLTAIRLYGLRFGDLLGP